ncbi:uncharacterized protein TRIADDRAFT_62364 [Trichoplax adhaerens]|uniref:Globin domain-containing protein n=1 Tax=Trichoplax adhaerens TaxID=10228 RepID=B3SDK5_TRIAD|nr:hypothetical protein TRIADDRAFT_62364 [Trichoplax adhaerens]EDV19196.1 hypothetical protein TRIADDRAFT_62364 [Trichoplax adhaerens]|eukprot:XP_002118316.1 hypothetical protein TRIADDRAFT_62364 [Trichoplax adhaerens]
MTKIDSENHVKSKNVVTGNDIKSYLNYQERQAIIDSWNAISTEKQKYGTILFLKLFELEPRVKSLFTIFDFNEPLEDIIQSPHFRSHAMRFMQSLETGVLMGFDKESCDFLFKSLGSRHHFYDLKSEFLDVIPECILHTIKKGCGNNWSNETADAWKIATKVLCELFREGLETKPKK